MTYKCFQKVMEHSTKLAVNYLKSWVMTLWQCAYVACQFWFDVPALVAQLDARPTGDQEATGLTPARSTFL